ncbi:hypothetical protein Q428_07060 [Fervidicella metallireducens AeB]|uniref:FHA domain-containing protein n=1 Tax=Fervidicella metallireducens AeB TaxID=1403537 RepID=A0A017RVC3_9CLOT|nr:FHA domain-containing protein [Fervidicella metallireducens]EYE88612.1 hypothetical protein Q428_07060 [Fervidicella metallireducens AeB]
MIKQISLVMRFVVIGLIYFVLFRIIRIMYMDLKGIKGGKTRKEKSLELNYALEVIDAPENIKISRGSVYPIHPITNIGRNEDNHVILDDPFVSGHHARIVLDNEELIIQDLNSTNGTLRNGFKLKEAEEIFIGDIIEIGRITFKVIG